MTGLTRQAAARGVSLVARARVAVDDHAIRQLSNGRRRPSPELQAAWAVLHPALSLQLLRNRTGDAPMDDWVDVAEVADDSWDDDEKPY